MSHPARICSKCVKVVPGHFVHPPISPPFALAKRILQASLLFNGAFTGENVTAPELGVFASFYLILAYSLPPSAYSEGAQTQITILLRP